MSAKPAGTSPMSYSDAAARELVSARDLETSVAHLCSLGEKVAGGEEERRACEFLTQRLETYGYAPTVHTFESYISYPRSARLSVHHGGRTTDIPAVRVSFGLSTAPEGITQDVVLVGEGRETDYAGLDAAGKIVLVTKLPSPGNAVTAAQHGARGMICMSAGRQRHKMIITPVWGTPEFDQAKSIPRIHVVSIARTDGDPIVELIRPGPVRATLIASTFEGWPTVRLP